MMCKFFIVALLTCVVGLSATRFTTEQIKDFNEGCMQQFSGATDFVEQVMLDQSLPQLFDRAAVGSYLACTYKLQEYQWPNGTIRQDVMREFLSQFYNGAQMDIVERSCSNHVLEGDTDGEKALNTFTCYWKGLKLIDNEV